MTEHADRIWAAARVLNEVAETEDQSGAINDLLAVANALRPTPAAPTCCELACYEDPGCACDGCCSYFASFLSERGVTRSEDAAPQPDPIPDHYPHPDGYQRDCRRCVIDAAPQPETQHAAGCCGDPEPHRSTQPEGHGYTCDLCPWGRDKVRGVDEYAQHLRRHHCAPQPDTRRIGNGPTLGPLTPKQVRILDNRHHRVGNTVRCACGYDIWAFCEVHRLIETIAAVPQPDTALTVERLARARATDGGWKEPNVTDRKWAEQFLAILRALGEGVES